MPDNYADIVYNSECLEHFPWKEYQSVLKEWCRIVKPGGMIRIEVPDFLLACNQILAMDSLDGDRRMQQIFFAEQLNPFDFHFVGLTHRMLEDDFKKMGFVPQAMANYMTLLGWTPPDSTQEIFSLTQAAESFSLERVNKAGAKFDWDKLDWINSQYLHHLPAPELVKLLLPYWQEAGYNFTLEQDGAWLEELTALIAPSLTRLQNAVAESQLLLTETVEIKEDAQHQLEQAGAKEVLRQILAFLQTGETLTADVAKEQLNQITKTLGVKKGVVMKSLRAGLMGTLQGPDLTQSWLLLNQKGWDQIRLSQVLANG
jgi:glutamyl-tRNA synthetase